MNGSQTTVRPTRTDELATVIAEARLQGRRVAIRGGGSKREIGRPESEVTVVEMGGFAGIIDYDPPELVLTVGAGTPLREIEALVGSRQQALAFDPFDHGPMFGRAAGDATIGGVIAAGVAGPLRLTQGGARDHLLGFEAVSGRAERFVAGAKVVKNVTGYDLPKLMAGSWGRLAALTQVTLKVLPAPQVWLTKLVTGLDIRAALRLMAAALRSAAEVGAAAHIPAMAAWGDQPTTALLLKGFAASVAARSQMLDDLLRDHVQLPPLQERACQDFWHDMATAAPLGRMRPLWRVNVSPSKAAMVGQDLKLDARDQCFDWGGGLVWIAYEGDAQQLRRAAEAAGGQAMLVRAPAAMREVVPALHQKAAGVSALEERVRRAFDPEGLFETRRF
jgi:glycolate oxidase FAD binding subunit